MIFVSTILKKFAKDIFLQKKKSFQPKFMHENSLLLKEFEGETKNKKVN